MARMARTATVVHVTHALPRGLFNARTDNEGEKRNSQTSRSTVTYNPQCSVKNPQTHRMASPVEMGSETCSSKPRAQDALSLKLLERDPLGDFPRSLLEEHLPNVTSARPTRQEPSARRGVAPPGKEPMWAERHSAPPNPGSMLRGWHQEERVLGSRSRSFLHGPWGGFIHLSPLLADGPANEALASRGIIVVLLRLFCPPARIHRDFGSVD
ncbi:hypothetical protein BKA56DRAFT_693204 [Ilyonectria sp. MPI-CAGE-AT-0026]|nr:hypothetical protein BKA56DRAFT_693204 [Ilyonectria sp. MPI-CAGE-AT-0026]